MLESQSPSETVPPLLSSGVNLVRHNGQHRYFGRDWLALPDGAIRPCQANGLRRCAASSFV